MNHTIPLPVDEIIAEYQAGVSMDALAKKHNTSRETIARRLRKANIDVRKPGGGRGGRIATPEEAEAMRTRRNNYHTELKRRRKANGLCRECAAPVSPGKSLCERHLKKLRDSHRQRVIDGICQECNNPALPGIQRCEAHRKSLRRGSRKRDHRLKDEVFGHYGGYVCRCCGITEITMLTLDHINEDGASQRREYVKNHKYGNGAGSHYYRYLKKNGYPADLQVLCYNCNVAKHRNGGKCPCEAGKRGVATTHFAVLSSDCNAAPGLPIAF